MSVDKPVSKERVYYCNVCWTPHAWEIIADLCRRSCNKGVDYE